MLEISCTGHLPAKTQLTVPEIFRPPLRAQACEAILQYFARRGWGAVAHIHRDNFWLSQR